MTRSIDTPARTRFRLEGLILALSGLPNQLHQLELRNSNSTNQAALVAQKPTKVIRGWPFHDTGKVRNRFAQPEAL